MAKKKRRAEGTGLKSESGKLFTGAFGGSRAVVVPGTGPLFPGPKYQIHRRASVPSLDALSETASDLARQLGPDHPRVKMIRKEIADRQRVR